MLAVLVVVIVVVIASARSGKEGSSPVMDKTMKKSKCLQTSLDFSYCKNVDVDHKISFN